VSSVGALIDLAPEDPCAVEEIWTGKIAEIQKI
jgi:hypothetical protein